MTEQFEHLPANERRFGYIAIEKRIRSEYMQMVGHDGKTRSETEHHYM